MIKVTCPFCGSSAEVDAVLTAGQHVICPYCERKFAYGVGNATNGMSVDTQHQQLVNVSCPHCGTVYAVEQSKCGVHAICHACNKEFVVGQMDKSVSVAEKAPDVGEGTFKFCAKCGAKMSADASFCPKCGKNVLEATERPTNVGQFEVQHRPTTGKLQNLFNLIRLSLVLSGITLLVSLFDVREYYSLGRMGTFVIYAAFLGMGVWLYVVVIQLKSWARKTYIVLTLIGVLLYICGIMSAADGNLFVAVLNFVSQLIDIYCVCLFFTKEVALAFEPDSKLTDARAVVNMMYCIGYWVANGLVIIAGIVWGIAYNGTDDWNSDCKEAAVAGSASAREDLIGLYTDDGFTHYEAENRVDGIIESRRTYSSSSGSTKCPRWLMFLLRGLAIALGGGAAAAGKKKCRLQK